MENLRKLKDWMKIKEDQEKGISAEDGNGAYFWDFESMKMYSPFDEELFDESERGFDIEDQEEEVKLAYKNYLQKYNLVMSGTPHKLNNSKASIIYTGSPFAVKYDTNKKECICDSLDLFRNGCSCFK